MKDMISVVFSHGIKSLEIIQAYLLLSFWPLEAEEKYVFLLNLPFSLAKCQSIGSNIHARGFPPVLLFGEDLAAVGIVIKSSADVSLIVWPQT
jgi:hypothetical protein